MKRIYQILFFLIFPIAVYSQVSVSATAGNPIGSYANLKAAFDAINIGEHQGEIFISINASTSETATAVLNASITPSFYTHVIIRPTGNYSIIGNLPAPLIDLNGADSVTIDGRIGGTGSTRSLTLSNSSTSNNSTTSAIRLQNAAQYNTIKFCFIESSTQATDGGIMRILSNNSQSGSINNTIANNEIRPASTISPFNAILTGGGSGRSADNLTITNNGIHDFYNPNFSAFGIKMNGSPEDGWIISGNSFYFTSVKTNSAMSNLYMINIAGSNHTISNNFFGGNSPNIGGTPTTFSGSFYCAIYGIYLRGSLNSVISGNVISNFLLNTLEGANFVGIYTPNQTSSFAGLISNNTIGSLDGSTSIILSSSALYTSSIVGIDAPGSSVPGTIEIKNNVIGSLKFTNTGSSILSSISGILMTSQKSAVIQNNIVGGLIMGALEINSAAGGNLNGIYVKPTNNDKNYLILNNTIQNLINSSTSLSASNVNGIRFEIDASNINDTATITGNTITNLSSTGNTAADGSVRGIYITQSASLTGVATNGNIANNQITGLSSQATGSGTVVRGIWSDNNYTGPLTVQNNTITNLSSAAPNTTSFTGGSVQGIGFQFPGTGELTVSNNAIYNLQNSAAAPVSVVGIGSFHGSNINASNISKNRVYDLRTPNNTGGAITGILLRGSGNNGLFKTGNNMISLQPVSNQPVYGVQNNATANSITLAYNSVYLAGTEAGSNNSAAFFRTASSSTSITAISNLWQNHRSGGSGAHYGIINANSTPSTGWANLNYNNFYNAVASNVVLWGSSSLDFAGYKSASAQEAQSSTVAVNFANTATADLHLSGPSTGDQNLGGIYAVGFADDYDGETRPIRPYKGADELALQPLPIAIEYFNGVTVNSGNLLNWKTAPAQNTLFIVERSKDGISFETIGNLVSSQQRTVYHFTDSRPFPGNNYYRLKIENMREYAYSQVLLLTSKLLTEFTVLNLFPAVTTNNAFLTLASPVPLIMTVEIYNSNGTRLISQLKNIAAGTTTIPVQTDGFVPGLYFIKLRANDNVRMLRLIKQ